MTGLRPAVLIMALLVGTSVAQAAPNAQLVASVQNRLNAFGFQQVDAGDLTTRQIAALHLELGRVKPIGTLQRFQQRQKIQVILGWDD